MSKISIIIPIYNVEKYLEECLDSVINQTYKNLEIICVNDCSSDNCSIILDAYAKKDSRIKVVNRKENGGVSAARNTGIEFATGEYLYFLDSDDKISADYIEKMVQAIENSDTDIVVNSNVQKFDNTSTTPFIWERYPIQNEKILDTENAINKTPVMIWTHLYKKALFDKYNLKFPKGYIHEDEYFQYISKINTDKIFYFYGGTYFYRQRENSIMSDKNALFKNKLKITNLILEFCKKNLSQAQFKNLDVLKNIPILEIQNAQEFGKVKEILLDDTNYYKYSYSHFFNFIANLILNSETFEEFQSKIGKNARIAYLRDSMNRKYKVSVIIPVYNVENYLEDCLNSICNQTLKDIEIICVNDCSTDNSLEILKLYQKEDNRIKIIDFKENNGVSVARNAGLKQAKGEYVGFIDSDDWLDLDFYEKLYTKAIETTSEVVKSTIKTSDDGKLSTVAEGITFDNDNKFKYSQYFWSGIYSKNVLEENNLNFLENITYSEDRIFALKGIYYAKNFAKVDDTAYYYRIRENSATAAPINDKRIEDYLNVLNEVTEFLNSANLTQDDYVKINEMFDETLAENFLKELSEKQYTKIIDFWIIILNKRLYRNEKFLKTLETHDINQIKTFLKLEHNKRVLTNLRKSIKKV